MSEYQSTHELAESRRHQAIEEEKKGNYSAAALIYSEARQNKEAFRLFVRLRDIPNAREELGMTILRFEYARSLEGATPSFKERCEEVAEHIINNYGKAPDRDLVELVNSLPQESRVSGLIAQKIGEEKLAERLFSIDYRFWKQLAPTLRDMKEQIEVLESAALSARDAGLAFHADLCMKKADQLRRNVIVMEHEEEN